MILYAHDDRFSLVRDFREGAAYSVFVMVKRVRHCLGVDGGPQRLQGRVRLPRLAWKTQLSFAFLISINVLISRFEPHLKV